MTQESKNTIFSDRRKGRDRRKQNLPMPTGLDRRSNARRSGQFHGQPWWLRTSYAAELVSERTVIESGFFDDNESGKKEDKPPTSRR